MDPNLDPSHSAIEPHQGNTYLEMEDSNKQPQQGKSKRKNSNAKESNEEQEDNISLQHSSPKKTRLSDEEKVFLELQQRVHQLLAIKSKDRSEDEMKEYKKIQPKYSRQKAKFAHLVEERPTASAVERKQRSRENMSEAKQERVKSTDRDRKATPAAKAATKERMSAPAANSM